MTWTKLASALAVLHLLGVAPLAAASLQVQPALVDVTAPAAASTVTLRNEGKKSISVQIRVFSWSQSNGVEMLRPTDDVIASPPAVELAPGVDYVARIVRVAKRPVVGEESYRLFVDQLPDDATAISGTVKLLVRYSIPVFFAVPEKAMPAVTWTVSNTDGQIVVFAQNTGLTRLRISQLSLRDKAGHRISFGKGLVGYALGRSTMSWAAPPGGRPFASSGRASISGQGNEGTIDAIAPIVTSQ
jgi:fimbrial chaperone protein